MEKLLVVLVNLFLAVFEKYYFKKETTFLSFTMEYRRCIRNMTRYYETNLPEFLYAAKINAKYALKALWDAKVASKVLNVIKPILNAIPHKYTYIGWDGAECGTDVISVNTINKHMTTILQNGWVVDNQNRRFIDADYHAETSW